jgi:hypothetical protein
VPTWDDVLAFVRSRTFLWGAGIAFACFVLGSILVPLAWLRIPPDYFTREEPRRPAWVRALRLVFGALLLVIGVLLIVLPGQGFLTVALGLVVIDFPRKRAWLERAMVRTRLLGLVNSLRKRFDKEPIATSVATPGEPER